MYAIADYSIQKRARDITENLAKHVANVALWRMSSLCCLHMSISCTFNVQ